MTPRIAAGLIVALAAACGPTQEPRPRRPAMGPGAGLQPSQAMLDDAAEDLGELRAAFLEWYFEAHPVRATELGVHAHDSRLTDLSRAGVQDRIDDLLQWIADLEQIPFELMEEGDRYDYAVLEYGIRAELLALEEVRDWANDPRVYTATIARGVASLVERDFAPLDRRAVSLVARLEAAPRLLDAARANLRSPPRLWTEVAIADANGLIAFLDTDLERRLGPAPGDSALVAAVATARDRLVDRLAGHARWLQEDLLPRSTGGFRLGRYLFQRKLRYEEHVALDIAELERINGRAITELRSQVQQMAREIDPDRPPRAIMDSLAALYPPPQELLDHVREVTARARRWVEESGVVAIPADGTPTVRDSPPYSRDTFTSLDAPGPFDEPGLEAFYNITNIRPEWNDLLEEQHLTHFSRSGLVATTLYETFPGHYVHRLYERDAPDLRKVFRPATLAGGWANYAAGMAIDEGFSDDPAVRLARLQLALQRHARWYAAIQLHARNAEIEAVVAAFMEIAFVPEFPARRDVILATREPMSMADALGRLQLIELQADYRAYLEDEDAEYDPAEFHRRLLSLGLPFPLAREVLMPRRSEAPRFRRQ